MAASRMLHVDAIQTAPPGKVTAPGQARRVSVAAPAALTKELLQTRLQLVLYYNKASREEVTPLTVAAWIKESLSAALPEHPVVAGRLRRGSEDGDNWEVKLNDSGVRLVQATAEVTMAEFMSWKNKDEGHLAYWEDVDVEHPNFSALFYIQVTEFQTDGYSIGVSCSLLLADPSFLSKFLRSWAQIHGQMISQGKLSVDSSMFHLSYFQRSARPLRLKSIHLEPSAADSSPAPAVPAAGATVLFKADRGGPGAVSYGMIAAACLREATRRLEAKPSPGFVLVVSDHSGDLIVEPRACSDSDESDVPLDAVWWDQLGVEEIGFVEGSKPAHVTWRVVWGGDGALVVVMVPARADASSELMISVTLPKNTKGFGIK